MEPEAAPGHPCLWASPADARGTRRLLPSENAATPTPVPISRGRTGTEGQHPRWVSPSSSQRRG